jgi:hypothetical protein
LDANQSSANWKAIVHKQRVIPSLSLSLIPVPSPKHVSQNTTRQLHRTQAQRRSSHNASQIEPLYKLGRSPPHGIQHVRATKGRAPEGSILGEAIDVGIGAAKERNREKGWPLERLEVLRGDEGGENCGWNRGLWAPS